METTKITQSSAEDLTNVRMDEETTPAKSAGNIGDVVEDGSKETTVVSAGEPKDPATREVCDASGGTGLSEEHVGASVASRSRTGPKAGETSGAQDRVDGVDGWNLVTHKSRSKDKEPLSKEAKERQIARRKANKNASKERVRAKDREIASKMRGYYQVMNVAGRPDGPPGSPASSTKSTESVSSMMRKSLTVKRKRSVEEMASKHSRSDSESDTMSEILDTRTTFSINDDEEEERLLRSDTEDRNVEGEVSKVDVHNAGSLPGNSEVQVDPRVPPSRNQGGYANAAKRPKNDYPFMIYVQSGRESKDPLAEEDYLFIRGSLAKMFFTHPEADKIKVAWTTWSIGREEDNHHGLWACEDQFTRETIVSAIEKLSHDTEREFRGWRKGESPDPFKDATIAVSGPLETLTHEELMQFVFRCNKSLHGEWKNRGTVQATKGTNFKFGLNMELLLGLRLCNYTVRAGTEGTLAVYVSKGIKSLIEQASTAF
jgi:hypothetical protein